MIKKAFIILLLFCFSLPNFSYANLKIYSNSQQQNGLDLNYYYKFKINKKLSLQMDPHFYAESNESFLLEPQILNFEIKNSAYTLKLGFDNPQWEGTDFVNPMDILGAKNYRDPLEIKARGTPGLFYFGQNGNFSWDIIYIPWQPRSILPSSKSPWWPRQINLPVLADDLVLLIPDNVEYQIKDDFSLNQSDRNNIATRIQYHGDNTDLSLAGFEGQSLTPVLSPIINVTPIEVYPRQIYQLTNPIVLQPIYYKQKIIAGTVTQNIGSYILRLAGSHSQSIGSESYLPGWSDLAVAEIEKTYSIKETDITILFEAIYAKKQESQNLSILSALYEKSFLLGLRVPISEKWTTSLGFFQEQKFKSHFTRLNILYSFKENLLLETSGELFTGTSSSPLGSFEKNDRLIFKINYLF